MKPIVSNGIKVAVILGLCGIGVWGASRVKVQENALQHQRTLYHDSQNKANQVHLKAQQTVKELPNTFQTIKSKGEQIAKAQTAIASTSNVNTPKYQVATQTMESLMSGNTPSPQWLATNKWSITPVYDGAGDNGQFKVAFYMENAKKQPAGLITTMYYDDKFHLLTQYYTSVGQNEIAKVTAAQYNQGNRDNK